MKNLVFSEHSKHPARPEDIAAFEKEFGLALPKAFVAFCEKYNGGFLETDLFRVPARYAEFHQEYPGGSGGLIADIVYGFAPDLPQASILKSIRRMPEGLFPITEDLLGNWVVLKTDDMEGTVYWFDHEVWDSPDHPHLFPIASNLMEFYEGLTVGDQSSCE
jgi:hypothetical protein